MRASPRTSHIAGASLALVLCACNVSPQPLPPGLDTAQMSLEEAAPGQTRLVGAADAVSEAALIRITNLANTSAPADAAVQPDGSFQIDLGGGLGDTLRLQAIGDDARSMVVDVTGAMFGAPVEEPPIATPCLVLEPASEQVGSPVTLADPIQPFAVTARNDCPADVTIAGANLRMGVDFQMTTGPGAFPAVLQNGDTFVIEYGFKSMTTGDFEDVLFITLDMVGGDRRAITVRSTTTN